MNNPDVIILDEPTRGIDVGAKSEIYKIMTSLIKKGKTIIMISSELPELIGMSDRILVVSNGQLTGEFHKGNLNQEEILNAATKNIKVA